MDFSLLPQYPLPSYTSPEDEYGDVDWYMFFSHVIVSGIVLFFVVMWLFILILVLTGGRILRLGELFE